MTGGQSGLFEDHAGPSQLGVTQVKIRRLDPDRPRLAVLRASAEELQAHLAWLEELDKATGGSCIWRQLEDAASGKEPT